MKQKSIMAFNLSPARNAEHYQINSDVLKVITHEFAEAIGVTALRAKYQQVFDIEDDCYLRNKGFKETAEVTAADNNRDSRSRYIDMRIAAEMLSPVAEIRTAANQLSYLMKPYQGAASLPYAQNTAAVADMVQKMREPGNRELIAVLGLTSSIDDLDAANQAFSTIYNERSSQLLTRAKSDTMKTIRPQTDTALKELVEAINSIYHVNELITKDAGKRKLLSEAIDKINALFIQLQATLSRAGLTSKGKFKDKSKPSTDETPLPPIADGTDEKKKPTVPPANSTDENKKPTVPPANSTEENKKPTVPPAVEKDKDDTPYPMV